MTAVHLFYPKAPAVSTDDALAVSLELILRLEAKLREVTADAMRLAEERDEARAEVERLRGIIQEWSYPRLYVQPGAERETLMAQLQENLTGALRPKIEAAEERGATWALRAKAQVVYALAGDTAYALLARDVCREARKR